MNIKKTNENEYIMLFMHAVRRFVTFSIRALEILLLTYLLIVTSVRL